MDTSPDTTDNINSNNSSTTEERDLMFEKVLQLNDVKYNRLVIPKKDAKKHFPLDSSTTNQRLFLNFREISSGQSWRFSYGESGKCYKFTGGWPSFVKDKDLNVGDIVLFYRGKGELGKDRLFINWKCHQSETAPSNPRSNFSNQEIATPHGGNQKIGSKRPYSDLNRVQESSSCSQVTTSTTDSKPHGSSLVTGGGSSSGPSTAERGMKKIREENEDYFQDILKLAPPINQDNNGPDSDGSDDEGANNLGLDLKL